MGDYIVVTDVESLIGDVDFTDTTTPTTTEVTQFITWVEGKVNALLYQLGFTVPVTATESKKLIEATVLWGAGALTLEAMSAMGGGEQENTRLDRWWKFYEGGLGDILNSGGEVLYDAGRATSPRINMLPTIFGDERSETVDHKLTFRQLAAKRQYENEQDIRKTVASWKSALHKVR